MRQLCRFAFTLALLASYPSPAAARIAPDGSREDPAAAQSPAASDSTRGTSDKLGSGSSQNREKESVPTTAIEVKPEIHYLRDRDGQLVPVPGIGYEEFIDLFQKKERQNQRPALPRYALRELIGKGQAKGDRATIQLQIGLRLNAVGWTAIPLGLSECTLSGEINYRGDGDYFFHFDSSSNQYVAWLKGEPRSDHELTFAVVAPVSAGGGSTTLLLSLPKAASSKLELDVPGNVTAKSTAPHAVVEVAAIDDAATRISAIGVTGNVSLAWSERDRATEALPLLLETTGVILVTIDGRSVRSEVNLTVRSFGRDFQEFRVRLPKGSILTGNQQAVGYTLTSVGAEAVPMVQVKLDEKTAGPVDVKFAVERTYDVTRPNEVLELAGFDVVEAPSHRQGGQIGVVVTGDWQVKWEHPRVRVRRLTSRCRNSIGAAGWRCSSMWDANALCRRELRRAKRASVSSRNTSISSMAMSLAWKRG